MLPILHAFTEGAVELRACPNKRGEGRIPSIFTRDADEVAAFCKRWDIGGYGVYFGVCTRDAASTPPGNVEATRELPALWVDIDGAEPLEVLLGVMYPPSIVVRSGGGMHAYWLLTEPEDISAALDNDHPLVAMLRQLKDVFGGDPAVCDLARIMRLPGTHNSKYGEPRLVEIVHSSEQRYDLTDLVEWLSWQPQLRGEPINPFAAAAEALGIRGSLDVDRLLADMAPGNLHDTMLRVSASLTTSGRTADEIVDVLMPALRKACGESGRSKNWRREESVLRGMIKGADKKFNVVQLKPATQEKPAPAPKNQTAKVGAVALQAWGKPLVAVDGEIWTYEAGAWWPMDGGREHALRACIQGAAEALGIEAKTGLLNAAWRWIIERPEHVRADVRWDRAGVVVGLNGALEVDTGRLHSHAATHWATRTIDCLVSEVGQCPRWLEFLKHSAPGCEETLQEWFGAALIRGKTREMSKGLIIYGPSRTGKTQIAKVVRALLGGNTCGMRVKAMAERFGMQPLLHASGWVADDAVSSHEVMDAEAYKVIVTGESVSIERKNKTNIEVELDIPVLLTMNHYPIVKDSSDAVYNRTLVLPMNVVTDEAQAIPIADLIIAEELPGVLMWAVRGWQRLKARGRFYPPDVMVGAGREFKGQNNPFGEFAELCLARDADLMVMTTDLVSLFNNFMKSEIQSKNPWSARAVAKAIVGDLPWARPDRVKEGRVWVGVAFKEAVLAFLEQPFGETRKTLADLNHGLHSAVRERGVKHVRTEF